LFEPSREEKLKKERRRRGEQGRKRQNLEKGFGALQRFKNKDMRKRKARIIKCRKCK